MDRYSDLAAVMNAALDRVAEGKGAARHATAAPFSDQPMMRISGMVGIGFPLGQVIKKTQEAKRMADAGATEAAINELLDAIAYLAGAALTLRKGGLS